MKILSGGLFVVGGIMAFLSLSVTGPGGDVYHGCFLISCGAALALLPGTPENSLAKAARFGLKVAGILATTSGLIFLTARYLPRPLLRGALPIYDGAIRIQSDILALLGYDVSLYVSHATPAILTIDWILLLMVTVIGVTLASWAVLLLIAAQAPSEGA